MWRYSQAKIKTKLATIIVAATGSALLVAGSAFLLYDHHTFGEMLKSNLQTQARILALQVTAAVAFGDEAGVRELLSSLYGADELLAARVYDVEGKLLASYERPGRRAANIELMSARHPIADDEVIGTLELESDVAPLRERFNRGALLVISVALLAMLLAVEASSRLRRGITQPLDQLIATSNVVSERGDYSLRVGHRRRDELGDLIDRFNEMLRAVERRDAELQRAQADLELRVTERTSELNSEIQQHRVTEAALRSAKDAAEAGARAKTDFLANMSHEIRTPMNGIIGSAELLLDSPLPEPQRELGQIVLTSATSLLQIVNDILDFSKIDAGHVELESIPFSPQVLLTEVVQLFAQAAAQKGIALELKHSPELPSLWGDPGRLRQVLVNLVGNAVKFTRHGSVELRAEINVHGGLALLNIEIADTGIGIAPEKRALMFERFTQADETMAREFGGTGLGLAIAKGLLDLLGGRISIQSAVGQGSTFSIELRLPVVRNTKEPATATIAQVELQKSLRVLLCEDNAVNRKVATRMLERLEAHVDHAADGREAVEKAQNCRYDLILMDCQMPNVDGFEATRQIRSGGSATRVPIVALTANALAGDRERCLSAGMDDYLTKPLRAEALRSVLAEWSRRA